MRHPRADFKSKNNALQQICEGREGLSRVYHVERGAG